MELVAIGDLCRSLFKWSKYPEIFKTYYYCLYFSMRRILSYIPVLCLCFLIIFTPLARGAVEGWAVSLIHLISLFAITVFFLEKIISWDFKWIKTPFDKPFVALYCLCLISFIFSMHKNTSLWAMVLLTDYLVIFYLVIYTVNTRRKLIILVYVILSTGLFISTIGLLKNANINPFLWWEYKGVAGISTFGNNNHFAGFLEMVIPFILGLFIASYSIKKMIFLPIAGLIIITAFIFSLSRGGWTSCLISMVFLVTCLLTGLNIRHKSLVIIGFLVSCVVIFIVLSSTPVVIELLTIRHGVGENFSGRMVGWTGIFEMIKDHPFFGTGPGTFSTIFTQYQPPGMLKRIFMAHNDYLQFTAETGLLMVFVMTWLIYVFYREGIKKIKHHSRLVRGVSIASLTGVTAILCHSFVEFNLQIPANAILFTIISAFVIAPTVKR